MASKTLSITALEDMTDCTVNFNKVLQSDGYYGVRCTVTVKNTDGSGDAVSFDLDDASASLSVYTPSQLSTALCELRAYALSLLGYV